MYRMVAMRHHGVGEARKGIYAKIKNKNRKTNTKIQNKNTY